MEMSEQILGGRIEVEEPLKPGASYWRVYQGHHTIPSR
ncbi:hypothetical protein NIES2104_67370 [Leptolyngbya sp. NIES-2104]|nr:hypothetical protein NIES2104_67370 [Leptolyngbya sp. NIES-2104]